MSATVPAGPLAVRWHGADVPAVRAGARCALTVELENAGSAEWRSRGDEGVQLSYHWLDLRGNAIIWDGERTPLAEAVDPGRRVRLPLRLRAPLPPGRYVLGVDLVEEFRFWFAEIGNVPLRLDVDVLPRIARRLAAREGDAAALAAQEEPLVPESEAEAVAHLAPHAAPAPDWSRRVLDAHEQGYGVVGAAIDARRGALRRQRAELASWAPGAGRVPRFPHPLLCPSVARDAEAEPQARVAGLPAVRPSGGEPALFDGRIVVRLA